LAQGKGIWIGSAIAVQPLREESIYGETLAREFNAVTAENALKFAPLRPAQDQYAFADADAIVEFAEAHDMLVRGHALVWHNQLPGWLVERDWTREELMEILRDHIMTVVGRYRGRIAVWDVVNEAVADSCVLGDTIWLETIGPDYIEMAFRWAHEADPDALLFYNDYGCEGYGDKSDALYDLLRELLQRGVPVHGVGLQMHIGIGQSPDPQDVRDNITRLAELGLQTHISEIDVRVPGEPTEESLRQQAILYRNMLSACLSVPDCKGFVMWGFTDRHSWVPAFFPGWGSALIFDESYRPKPAYAALKSAFVESG